jgi:predicted nucleic acid-binding protein
VADVARFLIDTSAAARMPQPAIGSRLAPLIEGGVVATCATLDAEALFSTRSLEEYEQVRADRRTAYEYLPTDDEHWHRAFDAQRALAAPSGIERSACLICSLRCSRPSTA